MQQLNWSFGARVDNTHIAPSDVIELLAEHKVLVVENAKVNTQQQLVEYAQQMGNLFPQVSYHNITPTLVQDYYTGSNIGVDDLTSTTEPGMFDSVDPKDWHQDGASYSTKRMIGVATVQFDSEYSGELIGDTSFCNLTGIYNSLSLPIKTLLTQLKIEHTSSFYRNQHYYASAAMQDALKTNNIRNVAVAALKLKNLIPSPFVDNLVKDSTWLNFSPKDAPRLLDLTTAESNAIINMLEQQLDNPAWIYQHQWKPNQLVIWDNRHVLHRRINNAGVKMSRKFWRVQVEV